MQTSEVFRTAFRYLEPHIDCSIGNGLSHGVNQVCPICKAGSSYKDKTGKLQTTGNVEEIRDIAELKPWNDFYKTFDFKAYSCGSCGYQWSWYKEKM